MNQAKYSEVFRLCEQGYSDYDPSLYAKIDALLADVEQTDAVVKARRLANVGPTLSSKRFAYPHIQSALLND